MTNQVPSATELVKAPASSWSPALIAAGLAGLLVGLFSWWPYAVIGAFVLLLAKLTWLRKANAEMQRLPRRQPLSTSPIPLKK
jgi:hypothetical protein